MFHVGAVTLFFSNAMFLFDCLRFAHICSTSEILRFFWGGVSSSRLFF